jgi:hypothetical protein
MNEITERDVSKFTILPEVQNGLFAFCSGAKCGGRKGGKLKQPENRAFNGGRYRD